MRHSAALPCQRAAPLLAVILVGCGVPVDAGSFEPARRAMVAALQPDGGYGYDIHDQAVLAAMAAVPRHEFVPAGLRDRAYGDHPLRIGHDQTISQPYVVAFMTQALQLEAGDAVLEVGTGSGYQAAVLAALGCRVWSIEIVEPLGRAAAALLRRLGYQVAVRIGDGYRGWPEHAPFDAVIVTAAPDHVPQALVDQLEVGGRMILPVGDFAQQLVLLTRTASGVTREVLLPVRFVPMTGEAQKR